MPAEDIKPMADVNEETRKFYKELNGGTSALVLLSVLDKAAEPMYGYQIAKMIDSRSGEVSIMKQGALYPVLRSLESRGLLESEIEPSVSGPPRRYYRITENGRKTLSIWSEIWVQTRTFVDSVLAGGK